MDRRPRETRPTVLHFAVVLALCACAPSPGRSDEPTPTPAEAPISAVGMEFATIDPGAWVRAPRDGTEAYGLDYDPASHAVELTRPFAIGVFEVMDHEWNEVMGDEDAPASGLPVHGVTWMQALEFCNRLSALEGRTPAYTLGEDCGSVRWNREADGYRLPTEAEWEYAARGGDDFLYPGNDDVRRVAVCTDASDGELTETGTLEPNGYGLYDMAGNVAEWVWDGYVGVPDAGADPVTAHEDDVRVLRGGSYTDVAFPDDYDRLRTSHRVGADCALEMDWIGFRVVRTLTRE